MEKRLSTLFLTIYMGRGFYFKTTQTRLSNWLSLIYLQVLRKHNGEFPIMTKIHNPLQNVSYSKSVPTFLCSWLLLLKNVSFISYCREPVIINPLGKGGGKVGGFWSSQLNWPDPHPPRLCCILLIPPQWQSFLFIPPFIGKDWSLIVNINVSITQRISLSMPSMLIKSIYLFILMKFYKPFICPCFWYL